MGVLKPTISPTILAVFTRVRQARDATRLSNYLPYAHAGGARALNRLPYGVEPTFKEGIAPGCQCDLAGIARFDGEANQVTWRCPVKE